jgi:hypothetical protein
MTNYKSRSVNSNHPEVNNLVIPYPEHIPMLQNRIDINERCGEEPALWGQFVDIETMSLFHQRNQIKCKKNTNWAPDFKSITEAYEDDEKSEAWYTDPAHTSVCFHVETLGRFVLSLFYGFTYIKNSVTSDTSTSIVKSPPL